MKKLGAFGVVAVMVGLGACGSDDNSSSGTTAAIATAPLSTASGTSEPATSVTTENTTRTTASDSTESSETSGSTASNGSTGGTNLDVSSRIDEAKAALQDGDFTTMLRALELSGLAKDLEDRQVTILAPTDNAFRDLSAGTVTDLLADPSQIDTLLKRHIIDGLLTFDELSAKTSVETMSGDTLPVTKEGGVVKVDGAAVTEVDKSVTGENGQDIAVFSIDRVLLDS